MNHTRTSRRLRVAGLLAAVTAFAVTGCSSADTTSAEGPLAAGTGAVVNLHPHTTPAQRAQIRDLVRDLRPDVSHAHVDPDDPTSLAHTDPDVEPNPDDGAGGTTFGRAVTTNYNELSPKCFSGTNGIQVLYGYNSAGVNDLSDKIASIRAAIRQANGVFYDSSGGTRQLRIVTGGIAPDCNINVKAVPLSSGTLTQAAGSTYYIDALKAAGYNAPNRMYVLFTKTSSSTLGYCGIGGGSDAPWKSTLNPNNGGPKFARYAGGCWDGHTVAHEITHNLGAVSFFSPNSTHAAHCRDDNDLMCYADGGLAMYSPRPCTGSTAEYRLDCKKDDYFNVSPGSGNYLATHWNTADSSFLYGGGPASPTTTKPAAIAGITSSYVNGTLTVSWSGDPNVAGWIVYSNENGKDINMNRRSLTSPTVTIPNVTPGQTVEVLLVTGNPNGFQQSWINVTV